MKFLLKLGLAFAVLVFLAVLGVGFLVDGAAKTAIEEGGKLALGVPTTVDGAHVGLFTQTFSLDGLRIANPKGFGEQGFMELDRGSVEVSASSLLSDTVEIPLVELDGIRTTLVQASKGSNYDVILANLDRFQGAPDPEDDPGKRFVIRRLVMKGVEVRVVPVAELDLVALTLPIGDIELRDVGSGSDEGVMLADLVGIVVEAILKEAAASGKLPPQIQGPLSGDLRSLDGLADAGIKALDDVLRSNKDAAIDQTRKALEKGLKDFGVGR